MKRTRTIFPHIKPIFALLPLVLPATGLAIAAEKPKSMPKEDVVEVSAIGAGPCLGNILLSNMVRQRDMMKEWDDSTDKLPGFAIAGKDRRFYPAEAEAHVTAMKDKFTKEKSAW